MTSLYPFFQTIVTEVPQQKYLQSELLATVLDSNADMDTSIADKVTNIYNNSQISSRHVVSLDFFYKSAKIEERLRAFRAAAIELVIPMAKQALQEANLLPEDIHKVIFVSSTGILAPSLDMDIIRRLELPATCERTNVLFMGCGAGINGIKQACDYLNANKNKDRHVLFVSVELSSMHIHFTENINHIITHSIFSDGLSVAILSSCSKDKDKDKENVYLIDSFSYIIPGSDDGITLSIDEYSIGCHLSKDLPQYIRDHVLYAASLFLANHGLTITDIGFWAVHPGGKRILESVQAGLQLTEDQLQPSWEVLKQYGNMLSSSVMFVLEKFKNTRQSEDVFCLAFSFSPGVGIEFLLMKKEKR